MLIYADSLAFLIVFTTGGIVVVILSRRGLKSHFDSMNKYKQNVHMSVDLVSGDLNSVHTQIQFSSCC